MEKNCGFSFLCLHNTFIQLPFRIMKEERERDSFSQLGMRATLLILLFTSTIAGMGLFCLFLQLIWLLSPSKQAHCSIAFDHHYAMNYYHAKDYHARDFVRLFDKSWGRDAQVPYEIH